MSTKAVIWLIVVLLVLALVAVGLFYLPEGGDFGAPPADDAEEAESLGEELFTANPTEDLPETNPFGAQTNPFEGYRNPFE